MIINFVLFEDLHKERTPIAVWGGVLAGGPVSACSYERLNAMHKPTVDFANSFQKV